MSLWATLDHEAFEKEEVCRERHQSIHMQMLLERKKKKKKTPAQTGLKECVGQAMTEGCGGGNTDV